ncbi:MAG: sporulation protein Cse60 [Bacilli bacterium]|nr:sporulation protein Cse60 [Bacilli bacterium]
MKVKIFDEEDEFDLENDINEFLDNEKIELMEIQYQVGLSVFGEEQIFCFSAMILYQLHEGPIKK